jgi:hypothetical protein
LLARALAGLLGGVSGGDPHKIHEVRCQLLNLRRASSFALTVGRRYKKHAHSYTWKRLGRALNMQKTLDDNGIEDESVEFDQVGIPDDTYTPAIHLSFNDDLTESVRHFVSVSAVVSSTTSRFAVIGADCGVRVRGRVVVWLYACTSGLEIGTIAITNCLHHFGNRQPRKIERHGRKRRRGAAYLVSISIADGCS